MHTFSRKKKRDAGSMEVKVVVMDRRLHLYSRRNAKFLRDIKRTCSGSGALFCDKKKAEMLRMIGGKCVSILSIDSLVGYFMQRRLIRVQMANAVSSVCRA